MTYLPLLVKSTIYLYKSLHYNNEHNQLIQNKLFFNPASFVSRNFWRSVNEPHLQMVMKKELNVVLFMEEISVMYKAYIVKVLLWNHSSVRVSVVNKKKNNIATLRTFTKPNKITISQMLRKLLFQHKYMLKDRHWINNWVFDLQIQHLWLSKMLPTF